MMSRIINQPFETDFEDTEVFVEGRDYCHSYNILTFTRVTNENYPTGEVYATTEDYTLRMILPPHWGSTEWLRDFGLSRDTIKMEIITLYTSMEFKARLLSHSIEQGTIDLVSVFEFSLVFT